MNITWRSKESPVMCSGCQITGCAYFLPHETLSPFMNFYSIKENEQLSQFWATMVTQPLIASTCFWNILATVVFSAIVLYDVLIDKYQIFSILNLGDLKFLSSAHFFKT
jgi:hypothetical protein